LYALAVFVDPAQIILSGGLTALGSGSDFFRRLGQQLKSQEDRSSDYNDSQRYIHARQRNQRRKDVQAAATAEKVGVAKRHRGA
jgi:hypothetical protein